MFVTMGYHPFSIVEEEEFKAFLRMLNPKYVPPSHKTLAKMILEEEFQNCVTLLKDLFQQAVAVALTTDAWEEEEQEERVPKNELQVYYALLF